MLIILDPAFMPTASILGTETLGSRIMVWEPYKSSDRFDQKMIRKSRFYPLIWLIASITGRGMAHLKTLEERDLPLSN